MSRINLSYLSAARASGQDAASFLQAQLTADLGGMGVGDARFAGYCNRSGNVLAVIYVVRRDEDFLLIAANTLMAGLLQEFRKYVLRARVELLPVDETVLGVEGAHLPDYQLASERVSDPPLAAAIADWRAIELRSGIVWLSPETSGKYLPQMLGLEKLGALSFRKGCYPGQEVIARVRFLGKLKRHPMVVEVDGHLEGVPGSEVHLLDDDMPIGTGEWVEHAILDGQTTAFLIVRASPEQQVNAIEYGGQRWDLLQA